MQQRPLARHPCTRVGTPAHQRRQRHFRRAAERVNTTQPTLSGQLKTLEDRLKHIATPMSLSIIGCVVNGPGEALMTDLGFTGGGAGSGMMYVSGKPDHKVSNDQMVEHIVELVEKRAEAMRNAAPAA